MIAAPEKNNEIIETNNQISSNHLKLIDATIETIAARGLADTTIAHVAKKGWGITRIC